MWTYSIGFVYLIKMGEGHTYKIGQSCDPDRRLKTLQTKRDVRLKLIHAIPTNNMSQLEFRLQCHFSRKKISGEWFHLSPEDVVIFKSWGETENER